MDDKLVKSQMNLDGMCQNMLNSFVLYKHEHLYIKNDIDAIFSKWVIAKHI